MEQTKYTYMVRVSCITYNHADYIEDAMNGFCMQETTFPFVCTIVDDASNDGEQEVMKKYMQEHFNLDDTSVSRKEETDDYFLTFAQHKTNKNCYFAVLFLKYNHRSINKSKNIYLKEWYDASKYIALCEGDDYWIAPEKLQKQIAFLESYPDYTMTCNRTKLYSVKQKKYIGENYCYNRSQTVDAKDVIRRTGLFISTCSIVYRKTVSDNIPEYWRQCKVGDYPLQIMCAMKGHVYYFNDIMSVYRVENSESWMGRQQWGTMNQDRLDVIKSRVKMLDGFSNDNPSYKNVFQDKIADEINRNIPSWRVPKKEVSIFLGNFSDQTNIYPLRWKIDLWIRKLRIPGVRYFYKKLFLEHYNQRKVLYRNKR